MVDAYSWIYDIVKCIINGDKIPLDEFNLVGSRKSAKTTSYFILYLILACIAPFSFGWVNVRERVKDASDMFKDLKSIADTYQIAYRANEKDLELEINGNICRFYGVDNNRKTRGSKKAGIPHFTNVRYLFIFFEERYEFSEEHISAVKEAVRSVSDDPNFHAQMIILNACNPWSKKNEYIKYCSKHMSWDVNQLKKTGNQISIVEIPLRDGQVKKALFQYTNWRVCREFLSQSEINTILDTWNIDPRRAAVVDYGLPGSEDGAIYTHLLNHLGESIYKEQDWLIAGGDYGWGRKETSGKTAFYFGGATLDDGIDIYNEYVQDNHTYIKSPTQVAQEVVEFYKYSMNVYMKQNNKVYVPELVVRVDNMAVGFIDILNNTARQNRLEWLMFVKCKKHPVADRIEITLALLAGQKLRINTKDAKYPVKLLPQELDFAQYEESRSGKQNRLKENDHGINGFEYAIENIMYKFNKEIPNEKRARRALW